jgi:hypothetical protein
VAPEGRSEATGESAPEGRSEATGESAPEGRSEATGESVPAQVTETARIAAAQAYIDALVSHDAARVPFAPGCTRVELGIKTGFSGNHLRRSLNGGLQYRVIKSSTRPEFTVEDDEVRARFDLVTKPTLAGRRVGAHIDETFLIPAHDGLIHHIRADIRPFVTR